MTCERITHAGSQWRKLCTRYGLDPDAATADQLVQAVAAPFTAANDEICAALDATADEWREWDHLTGALQEGLCTLSRAVHAVIGWPDQEVAQ